MKIKSNDRMLDIIEGDIVGNRKTKLYERMTARYEVGTIPKKHPLLEIIDYGKCKDVPSCKKHGALLCFKGDIWRCIVCGWAVEYVRT